MNNHFDLVTKPYSKCYNNQRKSYKSFLSENNTCNQTLSTLGFLIVNKELSKRKLSNSLSSNLNSYSQSNK